MARLGVSNGLGRPRYVVKRDPVSARDMMDEITFGLKKLSAEPNLHGYKPHPKQELFHGADTFGRLYIGGNRSGKTVGGIVEDLWWVTKRHPTLRIPGDTEIRGRIVSVNEKDGIFGIILPVLRRWILPSDLIDGSWETSWDNGKMKLTLVDGSFIDFKTYDQALNKHAGTSRHFVHFDEEPPQAIFNENMLRLMDTRGKYWITMTPVDGMTWVYDTLYEPEDGPRKDLTIIQVDIDDNPYVPEDEKEKILGLLSKDERAARKSGRFMAKGGLVYPEFQASIHATLPKEWRPPRDWAVWQSIDAGINNPTAIGYHAVSPDGFEVVTFMEFYGSDVLIKDWAKVMLTYEKIENIEVYMRTGDPAMKQRSQQTGASTIEEFYDHGINLSVEQVPKDTMVGINKIRTYLRINPKTGRPFWQMTENCRKHAEQFKRLQWDTYTSPKMVDNNNKKETQKKKDDHTCDEVRYFFTCLPDLSREILTPELSPLHKAGKVNDYIATLIEMSTAPPDAYSPMPKENVWATEVGFSRQERDPMWEDYLI